MGDMSKMSLGEFLRSRRERLTPEDVGLPTYGRRRTPGLRREEVAQLAHIGSSWYTSLEQGRSINPSEEVLNNIAKALRLTEDECHHLHLLARPPHSEQGEAHQYPAGLERMISALDPHPAFVLGRYWDLLLWNNAAAYIFRLPPFSDEMQLRPNWLRHLLTNDELQSHIKDWEAGAQALIAQFRADYARFPHDRRFQELIEEATQTSELFRKFWPQYDVQSATDHYKKSFDPRIGEMEFEHMVLQPPTNPNLKIMIYTASANTAARIQHLMNVHEQHV